MTGERRRAPPDESQICKPSERLFTWEGWAIAFIVTVIVASGGARVLVLMGVLN